MSHQDPTLEQLIDDTLFLMHIHDQTEQVINQRNTHTVWTGMVDASDAPIIRRGGRRVLSVRRVILELNGFDITHKLATCKCGTPLCLSHLTALTRTELQIRTAKTTNWAKSHAHCASVSFRRRKTATLNMEKVKAMREAASEGMTSREAGHLYGVSQSTAAAAIAGRTWKDYTNPFAGLLA